VLGLSETNTIGYYAALAFCRTVEKKANKQWIWIAMDAKTHQILAFHVGDRSGASGKQLWANVPEAYQQQAVFYTDLYEVYKGVIPPARHKAITKHARKTNHIERFNNTLRQRVSRSVRDTLSFSKRLLLDSRVVDVTRSCNPIFITISSLKPFLFNDLINELRFVDRMEA
jgi:insertion element IS1 protein InsB